MSDNHDFCRLLLKVTRAELTAEQRRRLVGGWAYTYDRNGRVDSGEYHVPRDSFYWHGSCCCAFYARSQGISAWLAEHYPEEHDMTNSNSNTPADDLADSDQRMHAAEDQGGQRPIGEIRPATDGDEILLQEPSMTLQDARKATGHAANTVARLVGCDRTTLYRIEKGETIPNRVTARKLHRLYMGHVSLAMIYDPEYVQVINSGATSANATAPWGDLPTKP